MGPENILVVRLEKPTGSLRGALGAPGDNETPPSMHPGRCREFRILRVMTGATRDAHRQLLQAGSMSTTRTPVGLVGTRSQWGAPPPAPVRTDVYLRSTGTGRRIHIQNRRQLINRKGTQKYAKELHRDEVQQQAEHIAAYYWQWEPASSATCDRRAAAA